MNALSGFILSGRLVDSVRKFDGRQGSGLLSQGNQAYVDGRVQDAIRIMEEVIRIEPKAISAWAALTGCRADMGCQDEALQLVRIMVAHLKHDPEWWYELAR